MKLSGRAVPKIEPPAKGYRLVGDAEIPGFSVRVTKNGARAFVFQYLSGGRTRRLTIGTWPAWSVTAAREKAKELRRRVESGEDPQAEKTAARDALTFAEIAALYLERHASKKRSGDRDRAYLERDVLPQWGRRKARDIERRDVIALVEAKADTAPVAANRLLACVRKVFNFAIGRDLIGASPCLMVKAPTRESRRERVLTEDEICSVWQGIDAAAGVSDAVKGILRLILATAQRPGECCEIERSEIDGAWWTIPGEKAKNLLAHRVPLNATALEIIRAQPEAGRYVFRGRGERPIQVNALAHAVRRLDGFGVLNWTPHDLRRTVASHLTGASVSRLVVSRLLNHAEAGVTAVYDRHSYDAEKRSALDAWDRKLRSVLTGEQSDVVEFSR